jgi:hypothetical protein
MAGTVPGPATYHAGHVRERVRLHPDRGRQGRAGGRGGRSDRRAESATEDELAKMVVSRVQMIDGITRTLTCTVVHL